MKKIDSKQNKSIKWVKKLMDDSKQRKETKLFICQSIKIVETLIAAKNTLMAFFANKAFIEKYPKFVEKYDQYATLLTNEVYDAISNYKNDDGIIAVFKQNENLVNLKKHLDSPKCNYLALINLQNPSNLGAIVRSALAFNISGIFMIGTNVDLTNMEVIRASAGYITSIPISKFDNFDYFLSQMKQKKITTVATLIDQKAIKLNQYRPLNSACFIIGNEGQGLDQKIVDRCDLSLYIDLKNNVESLNVATAVSIISFYLNYENNKNSK